MTEFVYLHGFASSPSSKKATAFKKKFGEIGISLEVPDLEVGGFENMTLTHQMNILSMYLDRFQSRGACLIGSSMGGYLAILAAQQRMDVRAVYLMAPGFNFLDRWMRKLNLDFNDDASWESRIPVFHYRHGETRYINIAVFKDAIEWSRLELKREVPTRIVHGVNDETVEIEESRKFASSHPWCLLHELDADHGLLDHIDWVINDCLIFFSKLKLLPGK
jgi:hypothetical protein